MADTANFGWTKPTVGGNADAWGTILNTALDDIDTDVKAVKTTADAAVPKAGGTMTGTLEGTAVTMSATVQGATVVATGGFGCNTKTAQTAYPSGGAVSPTAASSTLGTAWGLTSEAEMTALVTLVQNIRAALVANGTMS